MATMTNWIALNRSNDALDRTPARTVLNIIRSFQRYLKSLNYDDAVDLFDAHVINYNNPHELYIDDLNALTIAALYSYYQSDILPNLKDGDTKITSLDDLTQWIQLNPVVGFELVRIYLLNKSYNYVERDRTPSRQPAYLLTDPSPVKAHSPYYTADIAFKDFTLRNSGSLTRVLPVKPAGRFTMLCSLQTDANTPIVSISLNNGQFVFTYNRNTGGLTAGPASMFTDSAIYGNTWSYADGSHPNSVCFAVNFTQPFMTIYLLTEGVCSPLVIPFRSVQMVSANSYTLSSDFAEISGDQAGTRHVSFYPYLSDPREIARRLSVL